MTKIDIISGFLGAGKTTLIKKLIQEAYTKEQIVLIENEFGEIGIDGGFLKEAGIEIKEMNSGCICCSLVGDFSAALEKVMEQYHPERIIIEPSGVGKLSDVIKAVQDLQDERLLLNSYTTVVDGKKANIYMKNFGEFFNNQVEYANTIILSRTQLMKQEQIEAIVQRLQGKNAQATIMVTPWEELDGAKILDTMEHAHAFTESVMEEMDVCPSCHHHEHGEHCECGQEHHHEHGKHCECGQEHHHEHGKHCECGHEHHHEHDEHCECGQEHHHEHDEHCECGQEHHHEHGEHCECGQEHHHHADDVFTSWGKETAHRYTEEELRQMLDQLSHGSAYGTILRAKGMVSSMNGEWLYFDFVPEEYEIRKGEPETIGKLCVIGSELDETALTALFQLRG